MTQRPPVRILCLAVLVLGFAFTIEAQTKSRSWLRGTLEGTGYQIDDQSTWTMRVTAGRRKVLIDYPSLSCGGSWKLISIDATRARFKEKLDHGQDKCTDNGGVTVLRLSKKQVVFLYRIAGSRDVTASAVLTRENADMPQR